MRILVYIRISQPWYSYICPCCGVGMLFVTRGVRVCVAGGEGDGDGGAIDLSPLRPGRQRHHLVRRGQIYSSNYNRQVSQQQQQCCDRSSSDAATAVAVQGLSLIHI